MLGLLYSYVEESNRVEFELRDELGSISIQIPKKFGDGSIPSHISDFFQYEGDA